MLISFYVLFLNDFFNDPTQLSIVETNDCKVVDKRLMLRVKRGESLSHVVGLGDGHLANPFFLSFDLVLETLIRLYQRVFAFLTYLPTLKEIILVRLKRAE